MTTRSSAGPALWAGDGTGPSLGQRPRPASAGSLSREPGSPGPQVTSARRGERTGAHGGPREVAQGRRRPPRRPQAPRVSGRPRARGRRGHSRKKRAALRRRSDRMPGARPRPSRASERARGVARVRPLRQGAPHKVPRNPARSDPTTLEPRDPQNPELTSRRAAANPTRRCRLDWGRGRRSGRGPGGAARTGPRAGLSQRLRQPRSSFRDAPGLRP